MRQLFLDTETTGLSAEGGDRVIELGCVELVNRKLTGNNLHFYFNPGRDSHEDALKVHGISNEFLRDKPKFKDVVQEIVDYVDGAEIIIHNAAFDVGFLNKELELAGKKPFTTYVNGVVDTLVMAKQMYPGKRNSLDALCDRLVSTIQGAPCTAPCSMPSCWLMCTSTLPAGKRPCSLTLGQTKVRRVPKRLSTCLALYCPSFRPMPKSKRPMKSNWPSWTKPVAGRPFGVSSTVNKAQQPESFKNLKNDQKTVA